MFLLLRGSRLAIATSLFIFLCQSVVSWGAPKIPVSVVPPWVVDLPVKLSTSVKSKDVSGGYHVLLRDTQYDLASQTQYYHNRYLVFTDEGLQAVSEIQVSYDPTYEQLIFHTIRIWRNGKPIDKMATAKFKQSQVEKEADKHIYNEQLSAIAILDDVRLNDVVEFAYSVKGWNPIFRNKFFSSFTLNSYDPLDELYLRLNAPTERKINYKHFNTKDKPIIAAAGGQQTYTWHLTNIPAFPVDSDIPSWYDPYPWVSLSEFNNWQEFGKWAASLYEVKGLGNELQQEIDSIKSISGDATQRLTATVRFVQDKIRYLGLENGISGYKPHSPARIFKQRFGDCKDKSLLLSQMLQAMNIPAYPALVHTNYQDQVQQWLPSAYSFNHCIVLVELPGRQIWIDPTISLQRGNYDSIATPNYKSAFVLKNGAGAFVKMQTPEVAKVKVLENFIFNDISGPVTLEVKTYYHGSEADMMRSRLATSNLKELEKNYLNFYAGSYPDITVARDLDFIDDPQKNILTTLEEYTIKDIWIPAKRDKDSLLVASFYAQMLRDRLTSPSTVIRKMPISLNYPLDFEEIITVLLPEAWPVDAETRVIQGKSFRFQSDISYRGTSKSVILNYRYTALSDHVPVAETADYLKKQKEIQNDLGYEITRQLNGTPSSSPVNPVMVVLAVVFLLGAAFGGYKLYQFDPVLANTLHYQQEQDIGGWLVLVLIGLYATPIALGISLVSNHFFQIDVWTRLADSASGIYNPAQALLLIFELAGNIGFLVFSVMLLILFHQRRTSLPRLMVYFYGANFLFVFFDSALTTMFKLGEADGQGIFRSLIGAAIWIPYFLKSERVKRTFIQNLYQPEPVAAPTLEAEETTPLINA